MHIHAEHTLQTPDPHLFFWTFALQIGALPVLDAMVVELAKRRGFASLQDRWKQRWKAN